MNKKHVYSIVTVALFTMIFSPLFAVAATSSQRQRVEFDRTMYDWYRGGSELRKKIDRLDDERVEELPIPVLFGVAVRNLTKNFGDPRGGDTRIHEGLDMMAPEGTPIVSPTDAVVTRTGDGSGSGLFVATAAPGDETFVYMHLSEIADIEAGDVLKPGDLIGYVGHTGNAVASAPHLHFEVRDEDGEPTDPYPRLTTVFDSKDKMEYLEEILDDHDDEDTFAEFLVTKFRSEFTTALAAKNELPKSLEAAMKRLGVYPAVISTTPTTPSTVVPGVIQVNTVLRVGSRGTEVAALQSYLVKKNIGTGGKIVADGVFGPMTRQAVIEYQASIGLVADGVAGPKTLTAIKEGL